MALWSDLKGTTSSLFKISSIFLKQISGGLAVRDTNDSADAEITASKVNVSGNTLVINSDAAASGSDYSITVSRPTSGMSANYTLTMPVDDGTPGQVLVTDGSGVLSWTAAGGDTSACLKVDSTTLAFGASSPVTLFTTPSSAVINKIRCVIDTSFNGTPTVTIGITGQTSKYVGSTQFVLTGTAGDVYEVNLEAASSAENLIATYSAGGASAGSARILVSYEVPS